MDFFLKLKTTTKGPNSLGNSNDNNIGARYRGIDPSHLGRLDINVCGTSDPGTSAVLTPFCKTEGLYFDGAHEPENFKYDFDRAIRKSLEDDKYYNITPDSDSIEDYFNMELRANKLMKEITLEHRENLDKYYVIDIQVNDDDID